MNYVKMLDKLQKVIFFVLVVLVCVMMIVGGMQVFWRYILKNSLYWSEEVMRYLNIWTIFLGVSIGVPRNAHVAIDAIIGALKGRARFTATMVVYMFSLIFFIALFGVGIKFTVFNMGHLSAALRMPMSMIYISLPIGGFLSILFMVGEIIKFLKGEVTQ
ncbi:MAG: TRAP transporter small permease [Clostridiales bacterium]|nr:TRAP transporter small permease [Clostridiales bacterium]